MEQQSNTDRGDRLGILNGVVGQKSNADGGIVWSFSMEWRSGKVIPAGGGGPSDGLHGTSGGGKRGEFRSERV